LDNGRGHFGPALAKKKKKGKGIVGGKALTSFLLPNVGPSTHALCMAMN